MRDDKQTFIHVRLRERLNVRSRKLDPVVACFRQMEKTWAIISESAHVSSGMVSDEVFAREAAF